MTDRESNQALFETMLKSALTQEHYQELDALPSETEIAEQLSYSPQFAGRLRRLMRQDAYRRARRLVSRHALKTAAGFLIVLALTLGVAMSIPEVRAAVVEVFMEWFDTHTSFRFTRQELPENSDSIWKPDYIPDGFFLADSWEGHAIKMLTYQNAEEVIIHFHYAPAFSGYTFSIDNEHSDYSRIELRGGQADLFKSFSDEYYSFLIWQEENISFSLMSVVSVEELIKIAESVRQIE